MKIETVFLKHLTESREMRWKMERGEDSRGLWWMLCRTTQISTLDEGTQSASSYEVWLQIPHSCIPLRRCFQLKEAACIQYTGPAAPCAVARQSKGRKALPSGLVQDFSKGPSASDTCGTD